MKKLLIVLLIATVGTSFCMNEKKTVGFSKRKRVRVFNKQKPSCTVAQNRSYSEEDESLSNLQPSSDEEFSFEPSRLTKRKPTPVKELVKQRFSKEAIERQYLAQKKEIEALEDFELAVEERGPRGELIAPRVGTKSLGKPVLKKGKLNTNEEDN